MNNISGYSSSLSVWIIRKAIVDIAVQSLLLCCGDFVLVIFILPVMLDKTDAQLDA